MKKFLGLVMCALFVAASAVFVACSDDDEETTSNAVTTAIAEIKASNTAYMGVSDFTALTFSDFSNATNDPIYRMVFEDESATGERYKVPLNNSADIKKDNRYLLKTGHTKATLSGSSVACWSTPREDRPIGLGTIRVLFKTDGNETIRRVCANGSWIAELPTSGTIDLGSVKDFIAVKATGAGTVSASITNHGYKTDKAVATLVNENGKILHAITLTEQTDTITPTAQNLSTSVSANEVVMLIVSSNGASGGTIDINSLTFTPSSNSGSGTVAGTYKGTFTGHGYTLYMIMTINGNNTWFSQGYTDTTYSTSSKQGTDSGTYTQSGNSITLTGNVVNNEICTTSDNWNTVICSGDFSGTLTRQ